MSTIEHVSLEVADPAAVRGVYTALALDDVVRLRQSESPTTGFRGFTLSLIVSQPSIVNGFVDAATDAGAIVITAPTKSLWGYGGSVQAPDGTIVTVASSSKKDTGTDTRQVDEIVLQLGVEDVPTTKQFYADRGFTVSKSYGRKYVEFDTAPVKLTLNTRKAVAKAAGVSPDGDGSHRLVIATHGAGFTDPDGFVWEPAAG